MLPLLPLLLLAAVLHAAAGKTIVYGGRSSNASFLIIPGTKWCGNGNVATSFESLGSDFEADKCCRDHDTCPNSIRGLQEGYGLRNPFLTTVSECECDVRFYFCLKEAAPVSKAAQAALKWFFQDLRIPCFELVRRRVCAQRRFPFASCHRFANATVAELRRVPFYTNQLAELFASQNAHFRA